MKLKRFEQINEEYEIHDIEQTDSSPESELEKYKKCVKDIEHRLTHIKKEPYDYGEAADDAISDVLDIINSVKRGY